MTYAEYVRYCERVAEFLAREGLDSLSPVSDPDTGEWDGDHTTTCDCCGQYGSCYVSSGYNPTTKEVQGGYDVCEDCVYYLTYGNLDDDTMLQIEKDKKRPDRAKLCERERLKPEDDLPRYSSYGSYPIYYVTENNSVLCCDCANSERAKDIDSRDDKDWNVVDCDVNYEDAHLYCDECSERIESAYAEDEVEGAGERGREEG